MLFMQESCLEGELPDKVWNIFWLHDITFMVSRLTDQQLTQVLATSFL